MSHLNIEIKARCREPQRVRAVLRSLGAEFRGTDHQVDTYFDVTHGRLKLREGNIEHCLIHYHRADEAGPREAHVTLFHPPREGNLRQVLQAALDVRVVVDKLREIYFIDNVKFHVDRVAGLGDFVEIEAIDADRTIGRDRLLEQCRHFMAQLEIDPDDLLNRSYSDMLAEGT
ncbi:MAG: CYTH domain protein [Planctomycetes bacterium ADurb.Bin126]|nr:MAG: CYTH domain protein [Planctomycetes bacterium ADurb.Bin126]HOD81915.1 class IV adenylate cyclase [Phycisphaerae bacterium]HQL74129.1 class IV adenylate cyclase [Phycisphaerae bacterium]